ncbi:MAG: stage II sporulation protein M [Calditrichia bacterium]
MIREAAFLRENSRKWQRMESLLNASGKQNPDELAELYLEINSDLSFARTFYPDSKTALYLNGLAGQLHQRIYRNKKEESNRIVTFWRDELPEIFRQSRRELLYSFIIFVIAVSVGVLSTAHDEGYARYILGDHYINMTESNIESGDPMAVYKDMNQIDMFLGITFNNIRVSFMAFAMGIFFSLGTVYILITNGIMLGTFQYFFYQRELLTESALAIWVHGTLEISAIVIAGAAGMVMGNSLIFPGTFTRMQSLIRGARRGLKIVIGMLPIFVAAGFLESFVTRLTDMPLLLNLAIILGSLGFILWYVIMYPIMHGGASSDGPDDATS